MSKTGPAYRHQGKGHGRSAYFSEADVVEARTGARNETVTNAIFPGEIEEERSRKEGK